MFMQKKKALYALEEDGRKEYKKRVDYYHEKADSIKKKKWW